LRQGVGFGGGDQLNDDRMAEERLAAPIEIRPIDACSIPFLNSSGVCILQGHG